MIPIEIAVVKGGFEWVGCNVLIERASVGNYVRVREGRIGKKERPLVFGDDGVDGGWYFADQIASLFDDDVKVDIVLDNETDTTWLMVRSEDDTYDADRFDILLPLMRFDCGQWHVAKPHYEGVDE